MKFWDASAIIPLCLEEPRTPVLRNIVEQDGAVAAWWATPIECFSAFARLRREGIMTRTGEDQARQVLMQLAAQWTEIQPSREIRDRAGRLLLLHPLRAADSLQLAAALTWATDHATEQHFVCLDERLGEAAQHEGFTLLPAP
jgi:predicted nucleic acid-binding protein